MSSCEKCGHEIKNYGVFLGGVRCRNYCNMSGHGSNRDGETVDETTSVILCVKTEHGVFLELDRYESVDAAKTAALDYADLRQHHIDDHGVMVFRIIRENEYESFSVDVESGETW